MSPLNRRGRRDAAAQPPAPMARAGPSAMAGMHVHIERLSLPATAGDSAAYARAMTSALSGLLRQPGVTAVSGPPGPTETARRIAAALRTDRRLRDV